MQKSKTAVLVAIIAALLVAVPSLAFAQSDEDLTNAFTDTVLGVGAAAGTGMGAAVLMTILRVAGKSIKGKKEPIVVAELLVTVAVGAVVGSILTAAGQKPEVALGFDFIVIYFVNQILRPVFSKWTLKK